MKTEHQQRIEEFMDKARHEVPDNPCIPNEKVRLLRARLIMEEALETIKALGVKVKSRGTSIQSIHSISWLIFVDYWEPNLEQIVDGCADLSVVSIGTLSACGVHDDPILQEVDRTNLMKFAGDAHLGGDGKWVKPSDWKPPNILKTLEQQVQNEDLPGICVPTSNPVEKGLLTKEQVRAQDDGVNYDAENQEEG